MRGAASPRFWSEITPRTRIMTTDGSDRPPDKPALESGSQIPSHASKVWRSEEIFQGHDIVSIEHRGEVYQLRITRHGKLILNK